MCFFLYVYYFYLPSVSRVLAVLQVFVHIYSYLKSTTTLCHGSVMSQNGEASSSNATRPTVEPDELQGLSEEQRRTVTIEKCTGIVHEFRAGRISKPRAALRLQQIIPHDDPDDESFLSVFEPYIDMLENFERYR